MLPSEPRTGSFWLLIHWRQASKPTAQQKQIPSQHSPEGRHAARHSFVSASTTSATSITCLRRSLVFLVILSMAEFRASLLSLRPAWKTADKEVNRYSASQSSYYSFQVYCKLLSLFFRFAKWFCMLAAVSTSLIRQSLFPPHPIPRDHTALLLSRQSKAQNQKSNPSKPFVG